MAARADRILVRPNADIDRAALLRLYNALGGQVRQTFTALRGLEVLQVDARSDAARVVVALQRSGLVDFAEVDATGHALLAPNDPRYTAGQQWGLHNTGTGGGVAGADIMAELAWGVAHDAPEIIVAVLDSGIRLTHEDLAGNLWVNPGESGTDSLGRDKRTNGEDDDSNGYVDDVHGINVLNHSGNPHDDWGHGTHVAGIVGAVGNNALGISGVAWRVKIMACKFIDASGNYNVSDAVAALDYARSKGAKVVTAAWGKPTFTSAALRDAVIALRDANIILAAAAGNDGGNNETTALYPASYDYSNVIAVAATDRSDALATFSNYGVQSVDLGAPGANVLSCWNDSDSDYRETSGTSFAAAHVAGACALLWTRFPTYTHQQIIDRLLTTVDPLPGLAGKTVSGGRLNLAAALAAVSAPTVTSATSAAGTVGAAFSYQITATNSPASYAATNLAGTGLSLNATTGAISGTPVTAGTVSTQLSATNSTGTSAAVTLTLTIAAAPSGDATPPTISSFVFDTTTVTATTGSFVVTFSEPVTGVDAADFVMSTQGTATATITGVTPTSAAIYRVNFDYAGAGGSVQAAIKTSATAILDVATNAFAGGGVTASDVVPFVAAPPADSASPTVVSFTAGVPAASSVTFTLTFSEPVTGVNAADFIALGSTGVTATIGAITADGPGTAYTIPVTFGGAGSLQLMVLGGATASIRDAATNWFAGGSGQLSGSVTVGTSGPAPTITSGTTAAATVGTAFNYQIAATNSPTSFAATGLTGTGLSLNTATGMISGTPTAAGTIAAQLTATNSTGTSAAVTLTITVAAAPVGDTTAPAVTSFAFDTATVTATSGTFVITFSEPVTGVDVADFVIATQGTATATITGVTETSAWVYRVNFDYTGTSGSVQAAIRTSATGIADAATNAFIGGGTAASDTVPFVASPPADSTPPLVSAFTGGTPTTSSVNFTLTFSEPVTDVNATDFVILRSPSLNATLGTITADTAGAVYTIPVTFSGSGTLQLMVLGGATSNIRDAATNWFVGGSGQLSAIVTITSVGSAPAVTSPTTAAATVGTSFNYQIAGTNSPTSFAATNLTGTGLSLNAATGLISGTPTAAGTVSSQLTATNAAGTSAPVTLTITVAAAGSAPAITSPLTASVNAGASFSYTVTASNSPATFSASNLPTGLTFASPTITGTVGTAGTYNIGLGATNAFGTDARTLVLTVNTVLPPGGGGGGGGGGGPVAQQIIFAPGSAIVGEPLTLTATSSTGLPVSFSLVSGNATLVGNTLTPQNAGAIVVRAFNAGSGSASAAATTATFNAQHRQTLTFTPPGAALAINSPITLTATTSAGNLPITFTLVSGNATLAGNILTPRGPGAIVVRASQAGDASHLAASVETNFGSPGKSMQSITCPAIADTTADSGPIPVNAVASSGLPISLSVTGPARLSGNTLILAGASGTVTLRASAPGNDIYNPAPDVVRTFHVRARGQQVYLGTIGVDPFALVVSADGATGLFVARLSATGEALIARFSLAADGSFQADAQHQFVPPQSDGTVQVTAAFTASRSISGAVNNGVAAGTIAGLDTRFTADIARPTGPTSSLAGAYVATIPGSASGEAWIVAAPDGSAFAVALTPSGVTSGTGTITPAGVVEIATAGGGSISGNVDANTGTLSGTLRQGTTSVTLVGLSEGTRRSDRLVNLSSRLRVVGGDASRSVIAGFVVAGTGAKPILVRAVGPGLSGFGVQDALANPRLQLFRGSTLVAENDDWSNHPDVSATGDGVGAFRLAANSRDAALLATIQPGAYTAIVTGANGNGVVLVEVYDAATGASLASQQLVNLSTRGFVDTGEGALIAGFVVTGNAPKRVLLRGIGPALTQFGVTGAVADPTLKVYASGSTVVVAQNDDWSVAQPASAGQTVASAAELSAAAVATGAFALPAGSKDSALLITLMPGNYTAVVSGTNNTTGVALVEVYELTRF